MKQQADWARYKTFVQRWLADTAVAVDAIDDELTDDVTHVAFAARYCLLLAKEYFSAAFDAFSKARFSAGEACLRPIAEMAFTLLWCLRRNGSARARIERWMKSTFRERREALQAISKTSAFAGHEEILATPLDGVNKILDKLATRKCLPDPKQMLKSLDAGTDDEFRSADLYEFAYRCFCPSSHAPFLPERYFRIAGNQFEVLDEPSLMQPTTPWAALTIAYWTVAAILMYFGRDHAAIKAEYEQLRTEAIEWARSQQTGGER